MRLTLNLGLRQSGAGRGVEMSHLPGSRWSWREGQEYFFEHSKSKASYVGRKTSVMGNLTGEALSRSCVLVTFKSFRTSRSVRALGKDDRVACTGKKLLWLARFSPYTIDWQPVPPGPLQKCSCNPAPCQHPHAACWVTTHLEI